MRLNIPATAIQVLSFIYIQSNFNDFNTTFPFLARLKHDVMQFITFQTMNCRDILVKEKQQYI